MDEAPVLSEPGRVGCCIEMQLNDLQSRKEAFADNVGSGSGKVACG